MEEVATQLETGVELAFGQTSVGEVCAISRAVKQDGPEKMLGYCCLDTPLTSQFWGTAVSSAVADYPS
jgi:hypothetical protein